MTTKFMKRYFPSLTIRKICINTTMPYYCRLITYLKSKIVKIPNMGKNEEHLGHPYTLVGIQNGTVS
jgi:hypothetical protein